MEPGEVCQDREGFPFSSYYWPHTGQAGEVGEGAHLEREEEEGSPPPRLPPSSPSLAGRSLLKSDPGLGKGCLLFLLNVCFMFCCRYLSPQTYEVHFQESAALTGTLPGPAWARACISALFAPPTTSALVPPLLPHLNILSDTEG